MVKNQFSNSGWDIYHSTYIQMIHLENGYIFSGYSKKEGYAEKNNKQALLINWIIRMHKAGYLDKTFPEKKRRVKKIEYFLNAFPEKKPLLRLNYHYYECLDSKWAVRNRAVFVFLEAFYDALRSDDIQKIKSLYIYDRTTYEDPFDMSTKRFVTPKSLLAYCHRMIEVNTFTEEQANGFYKKYSEKYFS